MISVTFRMKVNGEVITEETYPSTLAEVQTIGKDFRVNTHGATDHVEVEFTFDPPLKAAA